jgi:FkbM family methyltransferase
MLASGIYQPPVHRLLAMLVPKLRSLARQSHKLAHLLSVAAYRRALLRGVRAAVEHERTPLPDDLRTVLDVGANRGQFALVASQRWPNARLVCFEPLPAPRGALTRVLRDNGRLRVLGIALTDHAGTEELHVSRADDSSSLLPITARQVAAFPGTEEVHTLEVRTARLDEEVRPGSFERPAALKIDVQGSELAVLHGATGILPELDGVEEADHFVGQRLTGIELHERALDEDCTSASGLAQRRSCGEDQVGL